tara:strand:- start:3316 stop:4671 length:1356 start_codon:yes stop_codon:yes gene_type:complete
MRKIISGRRSSGRGAFKMLINTAETTPYFGSGSPSATNQFYFPIPNGTDWAGYDINFTIDWGDGTTSNVNSTNFATSCLHTYSSSGQYVVSAEGNIAGFNFWNMRNVVGKADGNKLLEIQRWGDLKLTGGTYFGGGGFASGINQTFRHCELLELVTAEDGPWFPPNIRFNSLNDKGARGLFSFCPKLTTINNIANWDVSGCISLEIIFSGCQKLEFGTNAGGAIDLSNWDVSRNHQFERMFSECFLFDAKMFTNVGLNISPSQFGPLRFKSMFRSATVFNDLNSGNMNLWDTSEGTNMEYMFQSAIAFNQDLRNWDTSKVTTMRQMFSNAVVFNQNIGVWNTSSVTDMRRMFRSFAGGIAFDQDISGWNVNAWSQVGTGDTPLTGGTSGLTLSTSNYDALLLAWNAYSFPSWPGGTVDFGSSQYSLGNPLVVNARTSLAAKWGTILDGGGV